MPEPVYLDHFATTPCDPRVVEAMQPYWYEHFGNAASGHRWGTHANDAVQLAREQVAQLLSAAPEDIIWTSGATEANNLALLGFAHWAKARGIQRHKIITLSVEHKAVLGPCRALREEGFDLEIAPVNADGRVNEDALFALIDESTLLVSVQAANSEIGTLQTMPRIVERAHDYGAVVHCDAAQAVGKIAVDVDHWNVDFLSLSGHKFYAPKGIGALYARGGRRTPLNPLWHGGGQEAGLRPGTLPVALIAALGAACQIAQQEMTKEALRLQKLRDRFESEVVNALNDVTINGCLSARLPHGTSLTFAGIDAGELLANVSHLALSTGTACDTGSLSPSPTLLALGLSREVAQSTLRVAVGRFTNEAQILQAARDLIAAVRFLHAAE